MYSLISLLLQPLTFLFVLMGLGMVYLWWKQSHTTALLLVAAPYAVAWMACTNAVAYLLVGTLEWPYAPQPDRPAHVEAIVVLSGMGNTDAERQGPPYELLNDNTVARCLHAAALYRQGDPCVIVASGGNVDQTLPGPPTAALMRDFLVEQGVSREDIVVEGHSRSTYENAVESAKVLNERALRRTVLVTEAIHLYRAERCFRRQGVTVMSSGCRYRSLSFRPSLSSFLPSSQGASGVNYACHEWLGILWYWLRGRI